MFDGSGPKLAAHPGKSRLARLAPYFLAGPISGPLLAGAVFNYRDGRPLLGTLYAVALALFIVLLPVVAAKAVSLPIYQIASAQSHVDPRPGLPVRPPLR